MTARVLIDSGPSGVDWTSWGVAGWPTPAQRIAYIVRSLMIVLKNGWTPRFWSFAPTGWGSLRCCFPAGFERRLIIRQDQGDNDERLLGLAYFVERGNQSPFELIYDRHRDENALARLWEWFRDPLFAWYWADHPPKIVGFEGLGTVLRACASPHELKAADRG